MNTYTKYCSNEEISINLMNVEQDPELSEEQKKLIRMALKRHPDAKLAKGKKPSESFSIYDNCLIFWYNDSDGSTHIIKEKK